MLLCAEDDDLELVGVVHLGRQLGLELEVITALECDDGPFIDAVEGCDRGLFAIVRSRHLSADRALQLKSTFAIARREELEIITLRLTRDPHETLDPVLRKLARIDDWDPASIPDSPTGRFPSAPNPAAIKQPTVGGAEPPVGSPLGPVPQIDPPEQRITHAGEGDGTARNQIVDEFEDPLFVPRRTTPLRWFVGSCCTVLIGAGIWWQVDDDQPEPSAVSEPTKRIVEAAPVPPDEDELPADEPDPRDVDDPAATPHRAAVIP